MRAFLFTLLALVFLPFAALSQSADRPNTILVLDGSGSMWGQIDGVNKIVIARNVIADMLAEMDDSVSLGLTVYGHRQRGSCTDIETLVEPAPFTQDRILEAVNSINPRGRTPMTDAVIAAAQSLRHTEEAATVILVSDGIENCNPDPCAIAAELEASGVNFTAHVIGFDVASEPEARAQMQCIADNTGGQFLTADNAAELSSALEQVVEAATPTPMRIEAQILPEGTPPTRPVTWALFDADANPISSGVTGPAINVQLLPGTYLVQATRAEPAGPQTYQTSFTVVQDQTDLVIVAMPPIIETSQVTFTARVLPDMSVPASPLNWTLFDSTGTALLGPVEAPGGNVALLPGNYRLLVERVAQGTTHEAEFTVEPNTPAEVIIPLPALLVDVNLIARIGHVGGLPVTDPVIWEVTPLDPAPELATTNPATLSLGRGAYRVTGYWTAQEVEAFADFVIVDQPRDIVVVFDEPAVTAVLTAPATAPAASEIEVAWDGPGERGDMIMIHRPERGTLLSVVNVRENPETLRLPAYPGLYEITYQQNGGRTEAIGTTIIEVTEVSATLQAPDTVQIGEDFAVAWEGPGYQNDRIAIVPAGETAARSNGRNIRFGNPLEMTAPVEAGQYELHYILREDERVIGTRPIEVVEAQATLTAPATAVAGDTIEVGWTGPEQQYDFIAVRAPEDDDYHRFINESRIDGGNPVDLLMPTHPGTYVIEYILHEGRTPLAAVTIEVSEVTATVTAPASAAAGETIEVGWTGPDHQYDFIAVRAPEDDDYHRFINQIRTDRGSPVDLTMPSEPGTYVIEYIIHQDRRPLAAVEIVVNAVSATLTAPATASAGDTIEVGFTGPEYGGDFIGIRSPENDDYHRFINQTRTDRGNPADLVMPTEPGTYLIEYIEAQDRTPLAAVEIVVSAVSATITAPATASAGDTIEVGFTGPEYSGDFIGIRSPENDDYHRFINQTRTDRGNPADLVMPTEPGTYLIEYIEAQDRTPLAAVEIVVSAVSATLTAPANANVGDTIEVGWTGPDYSGDFIAIRSPDSEGYHRFAETVRTDRGNPALLRVPSAPGTYLIEYIEAQDRTALAVAEIVVAESEASITAPAAAVAGSTIEVGWTGPNAERDFIAIGLAGAEGGARWENYTRTDEGSPLRLVVPAQPGTYLIQYFLDQDRVALATAPITVTPIEASLTAPATAVAGETIEVGWTGPDYNRDFIAIGRAGAEGGARWENYTRTDDGNPVSLLVPVTPGSYVISYFVDQDRTIVASVPLEVSDVSATITAPATAAAGSSIEIGWTGPDYNRDFIAIGPVGAEGGARWQEYSRTSDGSPLSIDVPEEPGEYVIQYFLDQDRRSIASVPLTVQ